MSAEPAHGHVVPVERLPAGSLDAAPELAAVLVDCVAGGASVNFLSGLGLDEATAWWRVALAVEDVATFVARDDDGTVVGTVRMVPAPQANGQHRAEVSKLLVHRSARGRGVANALLRAVEAHAVTVGRWLLVLDTEVGSQAEGIYRRLGYTPVGVVEDFATDPQGHLQPAIFLSKRLPHG